MKKSNLFKTGATLAALVLAGCTGGNVSNPQTKEIPESPLMRHFGVNSLVKDDYGNKTHIERTDEGYKVVACTPYLNHSLSKAETGMIAAAEVLKAQGKRQGSVYGLRPFKSIRIGKDFCAGYTAPEQN